MSELRREGGDQVMVIDLEKTFWENIKEAAAQSEWIPHEHYFMNDWVSDVQRFLRTGAGASTPVDYDQDLFIVHYENDRKPGFGHESATPKLYLEKDAKRVVNKVNADIKRILESKFNRKGYEEANARILEKEGRVIFSPSDLVELENRHNAQIEAQRARGFYTYTRVSVNLCD